MAEQFCLRWNNHQSTLISVFENLLESGTLIDCTLYAEGQILRAHKVVLSACSPCFEKMLCAAEDKNPVIFLKDVKFLELKAMLDYMYRGEVNISQDQLDSFLKTAEALQIKGLTDQGGGGGAPGGGGGTNDVGEPPAKKGPGRKTGVSDVAPESPLVGNAPLREGSVSPGGTKRRRRVARRPSSDETSADNSCDIPPVAVAAQPQPQQTSAPPQASSTPISADSARYVVKKQEPMEPPTTSQHNMIQPKTEFIEETNEDIEDLTLDDDDDYSEMSKPGTSFSTALQGNTSQQDFSQWQMMGGDRTQTDEVFMAAQEAINNQSNTQGRRSKRPSHTCDGCLKRFTSFENLTRHLVDCKFYQYIHTCPYCEFKDTSIRSFKNHLKDKHDVTVSVEKLKSGQNTKSRTKTGLQYKPMTLRGECRPNTSSNVVNSSIGTLPIRTTCRGGQHSRGRTLGTKTQSQVERLSPLSRYLQGSGWADLYTDVPSDESPLHCPYCVYKTHWSHMLVRHYKIIHNNEITERQALIIGKPPQRK